MTTQYIGQAIPRVEDVRLTRGEGTYVADLKLPGMLHAAFLRSPHAHAFVRAVDASRARRIPGVVAVFTAADMGDDNRPLYNSQPHPALNVRMPHGLATERVRYVGDAIAVVVAEDRYAAEDGVGAIDVEYDLLPPVVGLEDALGEGAPALHDGIECNIAGEFTIGFGDLDAALRRADVVVRAELHVDRCSGSPLECRGVVADYRAYDRGGSPLTVWSSTQMPHNCRRALATMLRVPQEHIRYIAPDVGGGFGVKAPFYPEEYVVAWLATKLGRPVKWIEDRNEHFLTSNHGRRQEHVAELALTRDGEVLALKDDFIHDNGAYTLWGLTVPLLTAQGVIGPYRLPSMRVTCKAVFTSTTPVAAYRGAGRPQSTFVIERLMDLAARELDLDPVDIRTRNFVRPEEFPYEFDVVGRDGKKLVYDSGDYPGNLETALTAFDIQTRRSEAARLRAEGRIVGIGVACALEKSGLGPLEGVLARVDPQTGDVFLYTGASSSGQGQETMLAQVCAETLGVRMETVRVIMADTNRFPTGVGAIASRIATVGGNAVAGAATALREKALEVAAAELEANPADLDVSDGFFHVKGSPQRGLSLQQLSWIANAPSPGATHTAPFSPGLEALEYFTPPAVVYASTAHVAMIEIDPESGQVEIVRYTACHDSGKILNPLIVRGQVHGGIAAGIGNALLERFVYDAEGVPLTTTYTAYLMPTALDLPEPDAVFMETKSPYNRLGVKGVGQAGTMPVPAVIAAAIDDALGAGNGVFVDRFPVTPEWIWERLPADDGEGLPG